MKNIIILFSLLAFSINVHAQYSCLDITESKIKALFQSIVSDTEYSIYGNSFTFNNHIVSDRLSIWDASTLALHIDTVVGRNGEVRYGVDDWETFNYLYSHPMIDTNFSDIDKKFVKCQVETMSSLSHSYVKFPKIKGVKKIRETDSTIFNFFSYSYPLFSKDLNWAVIIRNRPIEWISSRHAFTFNCMYLLYKFENGRWKRFATSGIWM